MKSNLCTKIMIQSFSTRWAFLFFISGAPRIERKVVRDHRQDVNVAVGGISDPGR